jgi:hypothetical protein
LSEHFQYHEARAEDSEISLAVLRAVDPHTLNL